MSRYLKQPPSVFQNLNQRWTYYMTTGEAIKNELKVAIPLVFFEKYIKYWEDIMHPNVTDQPWWWLIGLCKLFQWCLWYQHRNLVALWLLQDGEISVFSTWFGLRKFGRLWLGSKINSRTKDSGCSCNPRI